MKLKVFVGPKGSGKDTCASMLKDLELSEGSISFAGPMKQICKRVFGLTTEHFEDRKMKEAPFVRPIEFTWFKVQEFSIEMCNYVGGPMQRANVLSALSGFTGIKFISPRQMLQFLGTEVIRNSVDQDWHCKAAFSEKNKKEFGLYDDKIYSVTDCRFLNEFHYLNKNHEADFAYVQRPEAEAILAVATHKSELEILEVRRLIQVTLVNNLDLEYLSELVRKWAEIYGK